MGCGEKKVVVLEKKAPPLDPQSAAVHRRSVNYEQFSQPAPDERRTKKAAKIESCRFFFPFSRSARCALLVSADSESVWLAHIVKCTGELTVKTLIYHQSSAVWEIGDDKVAVFGVMELKFFFCCISHTVAVMILHSFFSVRIS